jgi:hypothetical protein
MLTSDPPVELTVPPLADDPNAPEIYSDNFVGVVFNQGNLNLTFATIRSDHTKNPPTNTRKVVLRLIMPAGAVANLQAELGQVLGTLESKGFITAAPALHMVQ